MFSPYSIFGVICLAASIYQLQILLKKTYQGKEVCQNVDLLKELNLSSVGDFSHYGACFFTENYESMRRNFIAESKNINADLSTLTVADGLYTDIAVVRGSPENYLLHISGTHGTVTSFCLKDVLLLCLAQEWRHMREAPYR